MNVPDTPKLHTLLERLQSLSDGLLFLSESRLSIRVKYYPKPPEGQDLPSLLPQWLGVPGDVKVEEEDLPYFLRHHTTLDLEVRRKWGEGGDLIQRHQY